MSTVVLQVGQCGNQLGLELWRLITKKSNVHSVPGTVNYLQCVDSEPKVLRGCCEFVKNKEKEDVEATGHMVKPNYITYTFLLYGYHGGQSRGESGLLARTMEAVRKEATRQDYYGGTVLLHSLSGGTGSGLGSKMCEEIREEFPVHHILTVSVVPHQSGESPLQYYNTLLSLASMHRCADGILLFHNDHALSHAGLPRRSGTVILQQISLSAMNGHVASCMAGLMLPVQSLTKHSGKSLGMEPWALVRSVCPIPKAKLLYAMQASDGDPRQPGQHLLSLQMSYRNCDKVIGVSSGIFSQLTTGMIHKMRLVSHAPAYSPFVPITAISWLLDHVINRAKAMITA